MSTHDIILTNNIGSVTSNHLNNFLTLSTSATYVSSDIQLDLYVTKAVLSNTATQNQFLIQIPNGNSTDVTLTFTVDNNKNVLVT